MAQSPAGRFAVWGASTLQELAGCPPAVRNWSHQHRRSGRHVAWPLGRRRSSCGTRCRAARPRPGDPPIHDSRHGPLSQVALLETPEAVRFVYDGGRTSRACPEVHRELKGDVGAARSEVEQEIAAGADRRVFISDNFSELVQLGWPGAREQAVRQAGADADHAGRLCLRHAKSDRSR